MITKRKIVLASLLKPVNDPRMYEKLGRSLAETNKYEVNIIGFSTKNIPEHRGIIFHPAFRFGRLSLARLLAPLKYGVILLKVKPESILVTTPELLLVTIGYKILFGCEVIYDIQENYQQNIVWSSNLPYPLRLLAAAYVRRKEQLASRMIVHFFLAEKCYMSECSFIKAPFTVLENKARALPCTAQRKKRIAAGQEISFIYSGTIAESYGIFDCLQLLERWRRAGYAVKLHIIGYCPREDSLQKLRLAITDKPYIRLTGGEELVSHARILEALLAADMAFISYKLNPSNQDCFPTRIWECLAYKIPMLMKQEHPWTHLLSTYGAGLAIDFQDLTPAWPFKEDTSFYQKEPIPPTFYWESEVPKLLSAMEKLF